MRRGFWRRAVRMTQRRSVSAEATFGVGIGANVMTGGSENTLALQPLSINTQNGINFAVGVGEISLQRVNG
jgi:hypothetical protein